MQCFEQRFPGLIRYDIFMQLWYCFRNNTIVDLHPRIFTNKDIATEPFVLETPVSLLKLNILWYAEWDKLLWMDALGTD